MLGQGSLYQQAKVNVRFDESSYVKGIAQIVRHALAQHTSFLVLPLPAFNVVQERLIKLSWGFEGPTNNF